MGLGPILVFAPRRRAAEEIAQQLAHELPEVDPLELTGEQKKILGKELIGLIKGEWRIIIVGLIIFSVQV